MLGSELGQFLNQPGTLPVVVVMFADQDLQPGRPAQVIKRNLPGFTQAQVRYHLEEKLGCPHNQLALAEGGLIPQNIPPGI
jgi:hypothetical protein